MRANLDMDVAAFADKAHRAPHLGAADRIQPGIRITRSIQRQIRITSVGEVLDRSYRIVRPGIDDLVGADRLDAVEPRLADVEPDPSCAHRLGVWGARHSLRSLAENADG